MESWPVPLTVQIGRGWLTKEDPHSAVCHSGPGYTVWAGVTLNCKRREVRMYMPWNAWTEELVPKNAKTAVMQPVVYTHSTMLNAACGAGH